MGIDYFQKIKLTIYLYTLWNSKLQIWVKQWSSNDSVPIYLYLIGRIIT